MAFTMLSGRPSSTVKFVRMYSSVVRLEPRATIEPASVITTTRQLRIDMPQRGLRKLIKPCSCLAKTQAHLFLRRTMSNQNDSTLTRANSPQCQRSGTTRVVLIPLYSCRAPNRHRVTKRGLHLGLFAEQIHFIIPV